jgi:hypothetical protein
MGEIIMAIALWCSEPVNKTNGPAGDMTGAYRTLPQVQACRQRILDCHGAEKKLNEECFRKETL